jgi:hypothetical protein
MDLSRYGTGILASAIAEFVSSFYFVFCSCVATTLWSTHTESSILFIAVLSGLILAVLSYCSCEITNACANPVVTTALYLTQRLDRLRFLLFIPAQVLGGLWITLSSNERMRVDESWQARVSACEFPQFSCPGQTRTRVCMRVDWILPVKRAKTLSWKFEPVQSLLRANMGESCMQHSSTFRSSWTLFNVE